MLKRKKEWSLNNCVTLNQITGKYAIFIYYVLLLYITNKINENGIFLCYVPF